MRRAHYTPDGRIAGLYRPGRHATIPSPSIEISDDEWRAIIAAPGQHRVVNEKLVQDDPPPRYPDAAAAERAIVAHIDRATRRITGLISDDEKTSWPVKANAAQAYKAGTADSIQTAMLAAEAEKTGESVDALADLIVTRAAAYTAAIAPLTGIRRAAQRDLAASNSTELEPIVDAASAEIDATLATVLAAQEG